MSRHDASPPSADRASGFLRKVKANNGKPQHVHVGAAAENSPEAVSVPETDGPAVKYHTPFKPLCVGNSIASGVAYYGDEAGGEALSAHAMEAYDSSDALSRQPAAEPRTTRWTVAEWSVVRSHADQSRWSSQ